MRASVAIILQIIGVEPFSHFFKVAFCYVSNKLKVRFLVWEKGARTFTEAKVAFWMNAVGVNLAINASLRASAKNSTHLRYTVKPRLLLVSCYCLIKREYYYVLSYLLVCFNNNTKKIKYLLLYAAFLLFISNCAFASKAISSILMT